MNPSIRIEARTDPARARAALAGALPFGKVFADLMVQIAHTAERGWHDAAVIPFGPLALSPAAKVLHYSQEIFEGLKAYPYGGEEVALFRPEQNAARFNRSARRMVLPEIPEELQLAATDLLVDLVRDWVPRDVGTALYLRPTLIGIDPALGVAPSSAHLYLLLASPTGAYFKSEAEAISVWIEGQENRAFPGGVGQAKTGGNYAAGLFAQKRAKDRGYDQVLFLDGREHRFVEEMNGMNVFLVRDGVVCTPPLGDTILDGITRRSVLELAPDLGFQVEALPLPIDEVLADLASGRVSEIFTCGTGAGITPVGWLGTEAGRHAVSQGAPGPVGRRIHAELDGIKYGTIPDRRGWMRVVRRGQAALD